MFTILVVEDDPLIGQATERWLAQNHQVSWVTTLSDAQRYVASTEADIDMVLLDLGLPDGKGADFISYLKRNKVDAGIVIMTAFGEVDDKIAGLDAGADDYLVKPFEFKELDARIRAVKRRKDGVSSAIIEMGNIQLDLNQKSVALDGLPVHLSNMEYSILAILMQARGRYFSKNMLHDRLYFDGDSGSGNAVEVHISSIRKKLGKSLIKNTRGLGYIIEKNSDGS